MAKSETGWTDKYPHKSDAGDEYYFVRRKDGKDVVIMGFSMGKAWLNGVEYDRSEMRSHLFLGPLRPSDFEQLTRLRDWKESAMTLLSRYDSIAETFGGKLGSSKIDNLERGVERLREAASQAVTVLDLSVVDEPKATNGLAFQQYENFDKQLASLREAANKLREALAHRRTGEQS